MALDADEEILQDFLVEAGEILEKLSEQLVDLEQNPDDGDLLNAIFRGFHTVKGGAGFLQLEALVNCCHSAENVFDTLRNHKRRVDSDLMDVVLEALDNVNAMFDQVRNREEPTPAEPALIEALDALALPEGAAPAAPEAEVAPPPEPATSGTGGDADHGDITDEEFEQLLDALEDEKSSPGDSGSDDEITDDEFENLLDELHGKGQHGGKPADDDKPAGASGNGGDDDITDDEFESLLDDLHGKGQFKGVVEPEPKGGDKAGAEDKSSSGAGGDELITDDEFENLLDELHGSGQGPGAPGTSQPVAKKPEPAPSKPEKPAAASKDEKKGPATPAVPQRDNQPAAETTVRVDTKRLDDIMNMVGELVLVRNRLQRLGNDSEDEQMHKAVANLDVVTTDLQSAVMQTRMQPIKKVFGRFPRVVRDLARSLKKEINLVMHGEDTDLDKNLVEALSDPLVHLVRNSVDHGIEAPDVREKAGKPRTGTVTLSAEQEGDHILLSIEDDGGGMDPDKLRQKAVEKGLFEQDVADRLTHNECYNLIFAPGFSTKEQISDVSGRGVGMDVVKTKIGQLNGTIHVESEMGKGSRILIKVPLTLAIMPTLMIMLGDQSFALPLVNVVEIFHLDLTKKNVVDGRECIVVRDKVFPIYNIKNWLVHGAASEPEPENGHVVIVAMGTKRVGFVVDQLIGQEEVVIKPLGRMLHGTPGMAGATITGDGRIALIIDVPSLLQHYG
ncbi:chemotaxis protein CheA [Marinobacter halodurans]|uniref:histidine kinase n=1 Tax=Marinobacter halodurans TaxID=2528979 RepID=A0ABY1ZTL7_9GAMM|nr:chemotaxis protein CheA [Marinobacter halodurans]TBW59424.1 chemotaxis protein CheA [Marinobacter halodurans]